MTQDMLAAFIEPYNAIRVENGLAALPADRFLVGTGDFSFKPGQQAVELSLGTMPADPHAGQVLPSNEATWLSTNAGPLERLGTAAANTWWENAADRDVLYQTGAGQPYGGPLDLSTCLVINFAVVNTGGAGSASWVPCGDSYTTGHGVVIPLVPAPTAVPSLQETTPTSGVTERTQAAATPTPTGASMTTTDATATPTADLTQDDAAYVPAGATDPDEELSFWAPPALTEQATAPAETGASTEPASEVEAADAADIAVESFSEPSVDTATAEPVVDEDAASETADAAGGQTPIFTQTAADLGIDIAPGS